MLKIYNAIAVSQEAIQTGSTKPCLMTLADTNGKPIGEFVVKVFKPRNLSQASNTSKEIYGNILANAFDLTTPKAVLARVNQDIIDILNRSDNYKGFHLVKGTYFASEYIENALDYSKKIHKRLNQWEIENIFAFDVLIRNIDRHIKKPNLFFKDTEIYLIDHELCFATYLLDKSFPEMVKDKEKYWNFIEIRTEGFNKQHLFLEHLRELNKKNTVEFHTFKEYLINFDIDVIDSYNQQLLDLGNDSDIYPIIKSYLTEVKNNSDLFIQLLKDLIA